MVQTFGSKNIYIISPSWCYLFYMYQKNIFLLWTQSIYVISTTNYLLAGSKSISKWKKLVTLDLSGNQLDNSIFQSLSTALPSLQNLIIGENCDFNLTIGENYNFRGPLSAKGMPIFHICSKKSISFHVLFVSSYFFFMQNYQILKTWRFWI